MNTLLLSLALLVPALAPPGDDAAIIKAQKPSYPLATCVVSDEVIGSGGMTPVDIVREGRLVALCCKGCIKEVDKDPAAIFAKIDRAVIAAQSASYPLETCPVGGEKLGADAVDVVVGTKLVKLCCNDCKATLLAEPAKHLATVDAAWIARQSADYPLAICPISEHDLGDTPVSLLHGVTLVKLCCRDCVAEFEKDPKPALAKLAAARAAAPAPAAAEKAGHDGHDHSGH
jgi:hypothetical protein